MNNLTGTRT